MIITAKLTPTKTTHKKILKRFKKFGKQMASRREADLRRMSDDMRRVAEDETRRTRELFEEHRAFFEKTMENEKSSSTSESSIDFFEK